MLGLATAFIAPPSSSLAPQYSPDQGCLPDVRGSTAIKRHRQFPLRGVIALILAIFTCALSVEARAGWTRSWRNAIGYGRVDLDVTCANGATANALDIGFGAAESIPPAPGFGVGVPLPAGCTPGTFIRLRLVDGFWQVNGGQNALAGDTTDNVDLRPFVTPVSSAASTDLDVFGAIVSPTEADFTINWSGSNRGTAQLLTWYEYSGTVPSDFRGDNTELPNWSSLSHFLHDEFRVGPWSESITIPITATNVNNIIIAFSGIAVSAVPEPNTLALFGLSALGLVGYRRWQQKRTSTSN